MDSGMNNATIISLVEAALPDNILNGNYVKANVNMPLKDFLEVVLVNFIKEGETVASVAQYLKDKILPDVIPAPSKDVQVENSISIDMPLPQILPIETTTSSFVPVNYDLGRQYVDEFIRSNPLFVSSINDEEEIINTRDFLYSKIPYMNPEKMIWENGELKALNTIYEELLNKYFVPINPAIGKQRIDEFISNRVGFVTNVRTSPQAVVDTIEYLYSKIPFMHINGKILFGPKYKTIDEVYETLLNNTYRAPTLVDKTELCLDCANKLENEVLTSKIEALDMTVIDYFSDVLPQMIGDDGTTVNINGETRSVEEIIDTIAKNQRLMLERQKSKEEEEKLDKFNRTSENPSLISEIKMGLAKEEDAIEVTAEIPVVSSYLLSDEEKTALSVLPRDEIFANNDAYYTSLLNSIKQSIKDTTTEHDLTAKESGKNPFSFEVIAQEALQKIPTFEMQQLINSTSELIGAKRNELIKLYSNRDEYCDAIMIEINALNHRLELADSGDTFSEIKYYITRIKIDLIEKGIKEMRVKQALEQLETNYNQTFTQYNLNKNDFEKQKNKVVESLNDSLSSITNNYMKLLYIKEPYEIQSMTNNTNIQIESLRSAIGEALKSHYLTEEEANTYYYELNRLNTLGTTNNRLGV